MFRHRFVGPVVMGVFGGLLAGAAWGQTPVFEDTLTDNSKTTGQTGSGTFSAAGYTLSQSGGTSLNGAPRSKDFVWYDLPGVCSDGTGTIEFDVTGLGFDEGPLDIPLMMACDSTGLHPATVKDDFAASSKQGVMWKEGLDPAHPQYANKMKVAGYAGGTYWAEYFTQQPMSWSSSTVYRFRMCWNGPVMRMYRGSPGQILPMIPPLAGDPQPWTLSYAWNPGILHIEIGSGFISQWYGRGFGGDPGTIHSLLRVYEEDLGGAATPLRPAVAPRTEVSIDLGTTNIEDGLTNKQVSDGDTTPASIGGKDCRQNVDPATDHYFYFAIADDFAYQGSRPVVDITFDYYDTGSGTIGLQYDSSDNGQKYKVAGSVALVGDNTWKQQTFHITDAYLGNGENGGSDFRISAPSGLTFYIDVVRVSGPPAKAANPSPADQASNVVVTADLSWSYASGAASYDVYFGTASPGTFRGNQTSSTFDPGSLDYSTTYYWRVDSVGPSGTTTGDVWSFTTKSSLTEVSIDLGTTNVEIGLTNPQVSDGDTTPANIGGKDCRRNVDPATDHYFYFAISDDFAYQGNRPVADITFDYYDTGSGAISLQYDSTDTSQPNLKYKVAGTLDLTGTNTWKQQTFHVTDAYFGNRENGGSDFRISAPSGLTFYIDVVRVAGPPAKATNPSPAHQANYVSTDAGLSWCAAGGATSYDVYFGTTSPGTFRGNQASTTFDPGALDYSTTYYWRVDSVGVYGTTTGDVWSFTTRSSTPTNVTLGISTDGRFLTIDGVPTFLHGISYYGNQYITTGSMRTQDLDDMVADGFNWLRVWAYWAWPWWTGPNVSALNKDGTVREPYMTRMKTLIAECDARGIIIDVTMHRDTANTWYSPNTQALHLNAAETLATELLPYRNVYFDLSNERDSSGCYVSFEEMGELVDAVKEIDPDRLCSASGQVDSQAVLSNYINTGHVDFICIHSCFGEGCPAGLLSEAQQYLGWMSNLGVRLPLHWQEPFRRDKRAGWQPVAEDFYRGETGVRAAGAAGWCFHNGGKYGDVRPYRSYVMDDAEGRLYAQLDSVELDISDNAIQQIGSTDVNVRRYQVEYNEQISHPAPVVGRKDGLAWSATVAQDDAGLMTSGPLLDTVPAGQHLVRWRLLIDNSTADNDAVVTLSVRGGGAQLASRTLTRQEFTAANTYQTFTLNFTSTGQQDIEFRTNWLDKADIKCDWIELTIGGGGMEAPVIAEVTPDPVMLTAGVAYVQALSLLQGTPAPTWSVVQGPPGVQVNSSGVVSGWTPSGSDAGDLITFEIQATNAQGSDTESWQVWVKSRADFDSDNDVDQDDFSHLQACFSSLGGPTPAGCDDANLDGDTDVDGADLAVFLPCMGGANQPPGCRT